jgi:hypothetical protein
MRFTYSTHKTRDAAEMALEDYFATGEVSEGDCPRIEARNGRYLITLNG